MDNSKYEAVRAKIRGECWSVGEEDIIRLSHVLQTTENHYWQNEFANEAGFEHYLVKIVKCWKLTKDDLSLQSPDTIDFLFNILCE